MTATVYRSPKNGRFRFETYSPTKTNQNLDSNSTADERVDVGDGAKVRTEANTGSSKQGTIASDGDRDRDRDKPTDEDETDTDADSVATGGDR